MHIPFSMDRLLAGSKVCRLDKEDRQERVPNAIPQLNPSSSWVCRYQVAQMLDRHKGLPTGWLLAAGVCLVTAVYCVTKCTTQLRY